MTARKQRTRSSTFGNARKLPSGRWQASYWHDGDRHVAPSTFPSKADAQLWLADVRVKIGRGEWLDPSLGKITAGELAVLWLASNARKRSSSIARDRSIMETHVVPAIGTRQLAAVTRHDVQALVDTWASTQAPSTVGRQYSALRALFAFAESTDRLHQTPCRGIRLPHVSLVDRPELSADELSKLAEALGPDQGAMMWVGAVLGLRFAEAAGLTVGDLDLLGGVVHVRRQLGRDGILGPPKSEMGKRSMSCPHWLVVELAAVLARRGLTAADSEALVFVAPDGGPLHYTNWRRRVWKPATEAAGLPALRFHDLRSTAASLLVASGADVKTAQARLGHSSARTTLDLYARATARADRVAADAVGEMMRPSRVAPVPLSG